jgi:hypothetical protein
MFANIWQALKAFWELLKSKAKDWAYLVLLKLKDETVEYALDLAKQVVAEIEADPSVIIDEDKRKEAIARIKDYAGQQGMFLRDSIINFAIELAVQYWDEIGWPDV